MPVSVEGEVQRISQDEFHQIDRVVMKLAFEIQTEFGRFCDEKIYQSELAHCCREAGFKSVATEVPIRVCNGDFTKTYFMDLLVEHGAMYELKTAETIARDHLKQTLNYLLLAGLNHGKLINFRPPSVEHDFVSTRITPQLRRCVRLNTNRWQVLNRDSKWLADHILKLVEDWGMFLDVELFYEAITHSCGGESRVLRRITLEKDGRSLGTQRAHLLNHTTAFKLSAVTRHTVAFEKHLRRFLALTRLTAIQWINFNHHTLEFVTVTK